MTKATRLALLASRRYVAGPWRPYQKYVAERRKLGVAIDKANKFIEDILGKHTDCDCMWTY
jgi:hypothetical protein